MSLADYGYTRMMDFVYFARAPIGIGKKIRLLGTYIKLNTLATLFPKWEKKTRFCSFTLPPFALGFVAPSYNETFFRNGYWFPTKAAKPVIIECGANIGVTTLYFKWLCPKAEIYAFEPDPVIFSHYEAAVKANKLRGVFASQTAVSDSTKPLTFFRGKDTYGTGSLIQGRTHRADERITVKTTRLSSFIATKLRGRTITFLKIDIEGGELALLKDLHATGTLASVEQMIIEFHHHMGLPETALQEVLAALTGSGFAFQTTATCIPLASKEKPQDIMIYAYRAPAKA